MEVASELGHPAVAALEDDLLDIAKDAIHEDRVKQMVGFMVRVVLEEEGFIVDKSDVKIGSVPFFKGTRYKRPGWKRTYVYRWSDDPRELCLTRKKSTDSLPPAGKKGHWVYWSTFTTKIRAVIVFGVTQSEILEAIERDGFARHRQKRVLSVR